MSHNFLQALCCLAKFKNLLQTFIANPSISCFCFDLCMFDLCTFDLCTFDLCMFDLGIFDLGIFDLGMFDLGMFDLGIFDLGMFDLGIFDLGIFDLGIFDLGIFDLGIFDLGMFDLGMFDLGIFIFLTTQVNLIEGNGHDYGILMECKCLGSIDFDDFRHAVCKAKGQACLPLVVRSSRTADSKWPVRGNMSKVAAWMGV